MTIEFIDSPSPNFDARGVNIDLVVLHYTGMKSGRAALDRLTDAAAKVSSHYLVEEDGRIFRLVEEEKRAWHAGVSSWRGASDVNARSVGIEIVNPGHEWGYRAFPGAQIDAVIELVREIQSRWGIPRHGVVGHSDVAPERKEDPGELFPWEQLSQAGVAIGRFDGAPDPGIDYSEALNAIRGVGYYFLDGAHAAAVLAFQRRFCPAALGQGLNPVTKAAALWARRVTGGG